MKTIVTLILLSISVLCFSQKAEPVKQVKDTTETKLIHFNEWRAQEFINLQRLQNQINEKLFDLISNQARDEGATVTKENLLGLDPKPDKDGALKIVIKKKGP